VSAHAPATVEADGLAEFVALAAMGVAAISIIVAHGPHTVLRQAHRSGDASSSGASATILRPHPVSLATHAARDTWKQACYPVCVFITAGPSTKLFTWGAGGIWEDMCYERRRAEA
jgi:hypothetical protein